MTLDGSPPWVEPLVTIAKRFHEGPFSILGLFQEARPDLSDRPSFDAAVGRRLRQEPELVQAWQEYSWDKRTSSGPYMDGVEVGFYDHGRTDVVRHRDEESACTDFLFREARWVLDRQERHDQ